MSRHYNEDNNQNVFLYYFLNVSFPPWTLGSKIWFGGFPGGFSGKESTCLFRRHGFDPCLGRSHRSWNNLAVCYNHWVCTPRTRALGQEKPPRREACLPPGGAATRCNYRRPRAAMKTQRSPETKTAGKNPPYHKISMNFLSFTHIFPFIHK